MVFEETPLKDLLMCKPKVYDDDRGFFFESYNENAFKAAGLNFTFIQDNESKSSRGVLRGLHYQVEPMAQAKLVRVVTGGVFDVAVDIRKNSPTFGKWYGTILSAENKLQMLIPHGFAHGFLVLQDNTIFSYKCDNFYSKQHEMGILWNDHAIGIEWPMNSAEVILSAKDSQLPSLSSVKNF